MLRRVPLVAPSLGPGSFCTLKIRIGAAIREGLPSGSERALSSSAPQPPTPYCGSAKPAADVSSSSSPSSPPSSTHRRGLAISSIAAWYEGEAENEDENRSTQSKSRRAPRGALASPALAEAGRRKGGFRSRGRWARARSSSLGIAGAGSNSIAAMGLGVPSIDVARTMPLSCREMDNTTLLTLAAMNILEAREEVLKRHIMSVDNVNYATAVETFDKIARFNHNGLFAHTIPYKLGIGSAAVAAMASIPLCFHLPTVSYFNEHYVTADVPEPKDLETWLEVGSWAWNWMEPPLGQLSFLLLCMQFARAKLQNIGLKTFGARVKDVRAQRLVMQFPKYDQKILSDYSKCVSYYSK